ncbi:ABC transporter permease [Sporosarcina sp. P37]|uniref:lmo0954 family membrane protein n=1 Tax=unclassified Sporosarcina TaxID=2647733 RepID=UPI0009BD0791|nr:MULTISPECIES: ABC transporter permease [unclassified Sporosarcina]ARD48564.1 ABC transporter permease [Sporosarcina sp. P33]ARK25072.1 ABC transporter permease [Sporosarcina sp. P37]PID17938.1 ABC transporter permease [Sporosarcina sp. P35]
MKKFGLFLLGIIAGLALVVNLGSIIALAITGAIALVSFHYWRKSYSMFAKVFWMAVLIISLIGSISNIGAFIGIIALIGVYYVWRQWNDRNVNPDVTSDDPFTNFERQWNELTK